MTEQDWKDLEEFRRRLSILSNSGRAKTNNEVVNAILNECKHPRQVLDILRAFPKEVAR